MLRSAALDHPDLDALVERHQPTFIRDRQRKQVNVRDLLMPWQAVPDEHRRVRDGNIVRPQVMVAALKSSSCCISAGERMAAAVSISASVLILAPSLNKLSLPEPFDELFPHAVSDSGLTLLPIEPRHLIAVSRPPFHLRDPFDRLLIVQAQVEGLTIITGDSKFPAYGVSLLW